MYKPQLLTLFALLSCVSLFGQPVLNAENSTPKQNDAFKIITAGYTDPGSSGANVTWDFSGLGNQGQDLTSWVAPSSTPNGGSFPEADLAYWAGNDYDYYKLDPNGLVKVGHVRGSAGGVVVRFTDHMNLIRYPLVFETNYKDSFKAEFTNAGINIKRKGEITVVADGYGTVKLPAETASEVLRVFSTEIYTDEFNIGIGGTQKITYTLETYSWYKPNNHYPIVTISKLTSDKGGTISFTKYQANPSASIREQKGNISALQLYPNPASGIVNLNYELEKPSSVHISVVDIAGSTLYVENGFKGSGQQYSSLDISGYANGVYFLKVESSTGSMVSRLVKQ